MLCSSITCSCDSWTTWIREWNYCTNTHIPRAVPLPWPEEEEGVEKKGMADDFEQFPVTAPWKKPSRPFPLLSVCWISPDSWLLRLPEPQQRTALSFHTGHFLPLSSLIISQRYYCCWLTGAQCTWGTSKALFNARLTTQVSLPLH